MIKLKFIKTYVLNLECPYIDIHRTAEITEKAFSIFGRFYQARQIEREFFSIGCLMLFNSLSATLLRMNVRRRELLIKKDKETYYLSLFNSI